uniref:Uncharacterized protein n=1 Tax=Oryza sativa subsp. japonica TaxID=39947 RepID=Q6I649_ORYSJ|nr:unknown protein [Oryza sativa Japonica Group]AAV59356.1 unknown protein [Oryza sativa Japonica Group]
MSKPGPVIRVMKRSPEKSQCCLTADIARSDHGQIQDNFQKNPVPAAETSLIKIDARFAFPIYLVAIKPQKEAEISIHERNPRSIKAKPKINHKSTRGIKKHKGKAKKNQP